MRLAPFFLGMVVVAGCGEPRESGADPARSASAPPEATQVRWHTLGTWTGTGDRQTESFDVRTGTLKLVWEATHERAPGAGKLRVELYSSISGRPLQTIVDTAGVGIDSAYAADEPRVSYLVVTSAGVEWRLRLEEGVR